ncbi:MAG: hypothetical protein ABR599_12130 [Gemmatimonadota bacterium]
MTERSRRRAILSWVLLLLIGGFVGWALNERPGPGGVAAARRLPAATTPAW